MVAVRNAPIKARVLSWWLLLYIWYIPMDIKQLPRENDMICALIDW